LPVVDREGRLVGMITDRDICMCMALATRARLASKITVGEVMSGHVPTCGQEDSLRRALEIMREEQLRRLPVVDSNGVLCGTITVNDVIGAVEKTRGSKFAAATYDDLILTMMAISVLEGAKKSMVPSPPPPRAAKAS
jgi:CBS-domain-containing membrane protein